MSVGEIAATPNRYWSVGLGLGLVTTDQDGLHTGVALGVSLGVTIKLSMKLAVPVLISIPAAAPESRRPSADGTRSKKQPNRPNGGITSPGTAIARTRRQPSAIRRVPTMPGPPSRPDVERRG